MPKFVGLLWRLSNYLNRSDRRWLGMQLIKGEAEQIIFRRGKALWTGFVWDEHITLPLFVSGGYHGEEIHALLAWMEGTGRFSAGKKVIIEVGANIGTSSIAFAQKTDCHVLAIEPVPENFALLRQNVIHNGLEGRITCVQCAVSDSQGSLEMVLPATNSGGAEIRQTNLEPSFSKICAVKKIIEVGAETLNDVLRSRQILPEQVAFVWSDVQGYEGHVIESGSSLWLSGVPLYTELWPQGLRLQGGIEPFIRNVFKFFDRFVSRNDLLSYGTTAEPQPISELVPMLNSIAGNFFTEALLLPRGYEFSKKKDLEY